MSGIRPRNMLCSMLYAALCSLQCAMLHDLRRALCNVLCAVLHAACGGTQNMRHNLYPLFWFVAPSGMQHAAHHASGL